MTLIKQPIYQTPPRTAQQYWFVLWVGSRKEKAVQQYLTSLKVEAYVPTRERTYTYASKQVSRDLPVLTNYVFVNCTPAKLGSLLSVPFVFSYLRDDRGPSPVSEREIDNLRQLCDNSLLDWQEVAEPPVLEQGALVEIVRGPLQGLRGQFLQQKSSQVFLVAFGDKLTQLGTYEVQPNDIAPIGSAPLMRRTA